MAYDVLEQLSGANGVAVETLGAGTTTSPWEWVGIGSLLDIELRIGGAVAGTLDVTIQEADDAAGTNSQTLTTIAQQSASMVQYGGSLPKDTQVVTKTARTTKEYVRSSKVVSGGGSFASMSLLVRPAKH